jgi:hypothetical protein
MNRKRSVDGWLHGWMPKEPSQKNAVETKAKTSGGPSKKWAFVACYAINFSIVLSALALADYLGFRFVYKFLVGAAAAALAGAVGALVLKLPWRKKASEPREE